jgi:hypothetical protein
MSIPLFAAQAGGSNILQLDDPSVLVDLAVSDGTGGVAYSPFLLSGPITVMGGDGYERLRRVVQRLPHDGAATLTITPWRDGVSTGQSIARTVAVSDGDTLTFHLDATGSTFQLQLTVSAFDGVASLGSAAVTVSPRRSQR